MSSQLTTSKFHLIWKQKIFTLKMVQMYAFFR